VESGFALLLSGKTHQLAHMILARITGRQKLLNHLPLSFIM